MAEKPLLCRLGFHRGYNYLPKVGGDLSGICIACRRCGWGKNYSNGKWNETPSKVQDTIAKQAEIEFGRILRIDLHNPLEAMKRAYAWVEPKFSEEELRPIQETIKEMEGLEKIVKRRTKRNGKDRLD